ncbi:twin-arginine translocase TatA/TatE family subunit [Pseudobdellovibrio exovorus]|uniref:Sec-independent protein translocase protein TatA n=1 Tax=Pseudobdellovibrio exovorus JSS TaxID=1184267 RepID=M4V8A7_9BACT|nr:twin-arginine translocase TatA/TatE family subunit [Pseudobdellovibrio exovorus]AGH95622.1 hypothetical protein A11Q_1406 [Pseudobdellovibrio exovorus JSS]
MGQFSLPHLLILVLILLIFFGPSRLPQLGQSIGKAIKGFKDGLNELDAESKNVPPQQQAQLNQQQQQQNTTVHTEQTEKKEHNS